MTNSLAEDQRGQERDNGDKGVGGAMGKAVTDQKHFEDQCDRA